MLSSAWPSVVTVLLCVQTTVRCIPYRYEIDHNPRYVQPFVWNGQISNMEINPMRTEFEPTSLHQFSLPDEPNKVHYSFTSKRKGFRNPHVSHYIARLSQNDRTYNRIPVMKNPQLLYPGLGYEHNYGQSTGENLQPTLYHSNAPYYSNSNIHSGTGPLSTSGPASTASNIRKENHVSSSISHGIQNTITSFQENANIRNSDDIAPTIIEDAINSLSRNPNVQAKRESSGGIIATVISNPFQSSSTISDSQGELVSNADVISYASNQNNLNNLNVEQGFISHGVVSAPAAVVPAYPSDGLDQVSSQTGQKSVEPIYNPLAPISSYPNFPSDSQKPIGTVVVPNPSYPVNNPEAIAAALIPNPGYPENNQESIAAVVVPNPGKPTDSQKPIAAAVIPNPSYPINNQEPVAAAVVPIPSNSANSQKPIAVAVIPNPSYPVNNQEPIAAAVVPNPSNPEDSQKPITDAVETNPSNPQNIQESTAAAIVPPTPTKDVPSSGSSAQPIHKPLSIYPDVSVLHDNSVDPVPLPVGESPPATVDSHIIGGLVTDSSSSNSQDSVEDLDDSDNSAEDDLKYRDTIIFSSNRDFIRDQIFRDETPKPILYTALDAKNDLADGESVIATTSGNVDETDEVVQVTETAITDEIVATGDLGGSSGTVSPIDPKLYLQHAKINFVNIWNTEVINKGLYYLRISDVYPDTGYVYMPEIEAFTKFIQSLPMVQLYSSYLLDAYKRANQELDSSNSQVADAQEIDAANNPNVSIRDSENIDSTVPNQDFSLTSNDLAFIEAYKSILEQYSPDLDKLRPIISKESVDYLTPQAGNSLPYPVFPPYFGNGNFPPHSIQSNTIPNAFPIGSIPGSVPSRPRPSSKPSNRPSY